MAEPGPVGLRSRTYGWVLILVGVVAASGCGAGPSPSGDVTAPQSTETSRLPENPILPSPADESVRRIDLHNDSAKELDDCPDDESDWWHFVIAPNSDRYAFARIHLNLDGVEITFEEADLWSNGGQWDNVFVEVPDGYVLESLSRQGSAADVYPDPERVKFVLSHVCRGASFEDDRPLEESTPSPPSEVPTSLGNQFGKPSSGLPSVPISEEGAVSPESRQPSTSSNSARPESVDSVPPGADPVMTDPSTSDAPGGADEPIEGPVTGVDLGSSTGFGLLALVLGMSILIVRRSCSPDRSFRKENK